MTPPIPSGRRRITEAQLRATAGLTGRFTPTRPGLVLAAFKKAAPALDIRRGVVDLIDGLMAFSQPCDWRGEWRPIVWPSNELLADLLGLEVSRVKELVRAALDAGLILAIDHGTRKRFGKRDATGRILFAYGFDLSPLAERMGLFEQAAAEQEARREEAKSLRREISRLRAAVLGLVECAGTADAPPLDWPAMAGRARELGEQARQVRDPLALAPIAGRLRAIHAEAEAALASAFLVENCPAEPENRPHNTTTNQLSIGTPIASAAKPALESSSGRSGVPQGPRSGIQVGALRGFPMTPSVALQIAPAFRDLVPSSRPTWQEISEAAYIVRGALGISQHAYGQACLVLGRYEAATAIAAISAKHDAGLVRSPGGLLRHMVEAHQAGTLHLDRTLFGLVDKAGGLRSAGQRKTCRQNAASVAREGERGA